MKTFGIVHQVARMHPEKLSQQHPSGIGEVRARAALDLREVGLADRTPFLTSDGADDFLLRHLAVQAPERSLHQPQVANFLSETHIAICDQYIADCDLRNSTRSGVTRQVAESER